MPAESRPDHLRSAGRDRLLDIGAVAAITAVIATVTARYQPQIAVNDGRGWDGNSYYAVAEQLSHGATVLGDAPFVYRLLVPAAAALLSPDDLMAGFKIVNAVAVLAVIALMLAWLRAHFRARWVRLVLVTLFLMQWTEPLRSYFWYPVLVDYWFAAAVLAGLLVIDRLRAGGRRRVWLPLLVLATVLAVAVREIGLLVAFAALFAGNPVTGPLWRVRERWADLRTVPPTQWLPLPAGLLTVLVAHLVAIGTGTYSSVRSAGYWLLNKSPLALVLGWFISYGPVLLLPLLYRRACARHLREHQAEAAFLVGLVAVSWIGGNDTERFVTWGAPVIYVLIGIGLQKLVADRVHPVFPVLLAVAQAVAARLIWIVPAQPVDAGSVPETVLLTPLGNDISVYDLAAWDAAPAVRLTLVAEYLVLFAVLVGVFLLTRRRRRVAVAA